uniref:Uncharacterized protein n=1 Tax=Avena sativa TaxID=4498 RepID=A0ACD5ZQL5_AVESA
MEEIVLGLSKTVVEGTLIKVKAAIEEEAKLKLTVQSDLVFITGEFELMQSFLNVADAGRIRNNAVKTWVRQLRDLAYDTEDCIELVVHLDPTPSWWRRLLVLPCLPSVSLPIDDAAAEIKELKDRVEYVSQRNMRYNLITDFGGTKSALQQQIDRAAGGTGRTLDIPIESAEKKGRSLVDLRELVPNKEDRPELGVISVWGTGGDLGMASIIRKAYDDPEICKNFELRGWAKLAHTSDPRKVLRSLLTQFCTKYTCAPRQQGETLDVDSLFRMEKMVVEEEELVKEFLNHVETQRYLVVLEDLITMAEWDALRMYLPDMGNGSQIIISTQHFDIASLCTGQPHKVSEFRKFTADHSVCVFFKEVSGGGAAGNTVQGDDEVVLIGRDQEKKELISRIVEVSRVISVWGVAGVGKSALVRSAYNHYVEERPSFPGSDLCYIHGWVNVPRPFNLREFCRSLVLDLSSEPAKAKEDAAAGLANMTNPIDVCRKLLTDEHNKCVIVIDDLQSTEDWDTIKQALSFGEGCCIILVTNESGVAKHCSGQHQLVFNLKGLGDEHALQLFDKVYEGQLNHIIRDEDMKTQAKLILNKCGGLPKVIVAISCFLAKNLNWEAMNNNFINQLENNPELSSVHSLFGWLDSYFRNCPDELKPCIFYLSIFPRRHGIRRRRLVRRWIAEGYSRDTDGNLAEVNGENYFSRLVNLSMLTDAERGVDVAGSGIGRRMAKCNVNDFFREYIVSRRMEENHVFALEGRCSQTTRRTGRHLVIYKSWDGDENVFNKIEFSRLRSLTVFGAWKPFFASDKMRVVRVLDLEGTEGLIDDDIKNIVKRLPRLKFLSLRRCKGIFRLPESLGRLRQLETLDVRHTAIALMPATIVKLKKLQYVRAGNSSPQCVNSNTSASRRTWISACLSCSSKPEAGVVGVEVHWGIGELTNLHTLGVIKATSAGLEELKKLTQLRKLGVSGINRSNHKKLCDAVSGHGHLESLSIWLDKDTQEIDPSVQDGDFEAPEKLRTLKLHGHGHVDRLPEWIRRLRQLNLEVSTFAAQDQQDGGDRQEIKEASSAGQASVRQN